MEPGSGSHRIIAELLAARTGQYLAPGRMWRIGSAFTAAAGSGWVRANSITRAICTGARPSLRSRFVSDPRARSSRSRTCACDRSGLRSSASAAPSRNGLPIA